jgi:hypothetical protein
VGTPSSSAPMNISQGEQAAFLQAELPVVAALSSTIPSATY